MKRKLIGWELKKLWTFPMLPVFIVLCILLNACLVNPYNYEYEDVKYARYVNQVAGKLYEVQHNLEADGTEFQTVLDAAPSGEMKGRLREETAELTDILDGMDAHIFLERYQDEIKKGSLSEKLLSLKYDRLQAAVDCLAASNAAMSLALAGASTTVCGVLFHILCRAILLEGMVLSALMALYLYGLEHTEKTAAIVYVSKTGRKVQLMKLVAGGVSALLSYIVIAGISVLLFVCMWKVPFYFLADMSSQFQSIEIMKLVPNIYITWTDFTVAGYLAAVLAVGVFLVFLFQLLGCAAGMLAGNTYKGFLLLALLMAGNTLLFGMAGDNGSWGLCQILIWTPMALWKMAAAWFTDMGAVGLVPWQECASAVFCLFIGVIFFTKVFHWYENHDIV